MKLRHELSSNSMVFTTTRITNHNCHTNILSQWLRHSSSNFKVRLHLTANQDKSYENFHIYAKLHHFIDNNYKPFPNLHRHIKKNNVFIPLIVPKELLQPSINNRTISSNINQIVNISENNKNRSHTRMRRNNMLRENNNNDENAYGDEDQNYSRNQQEDIAEQKRGFDGEYYLPVETKFKMRDNNELYEDRIGHISSHVRDKERNPEKKIMQNDEKLINPDRLSNDYNLNLNDDNYRKYFKMNHNRKKFHKKNFHAYNYMLDKQRNMNEKKYLDNDYLDKQDQLENED